MISPSTETSVPTKHEQSDIEMESVGEAKNDFVEFVTFFYPTSKTGSAGFKLILASPDKKLGTDALAFTLESHGKKKAKKGKEESKKEYDENKPFQLYLKYAEIEFLGKYLSAIDKKPRTVQAVKNSARILSMEEVRSEEHRNFVYKLISLKPTGKQDEDEVAADGTIIKHCNIKMAIARDHWFGVGEMLKQVLLLVDTAREANSPVGLKTLKQEMLLTTYFSTLARKLLTKTIYDEIVKRTSDVMGFPFGNFEDVKYIQDIPVDSPEMMCKAIDLLTESV